MKIYFEDGLLNIINPPADTEYVVDSVYGVTNNIDLLDGLKELNEPLIIYTNSIFAFDNKYAWNEELKVPEVYIRAGEDRVFTRIDKLTNRELREGHNLAKMYINGEFYD